MFEGPVGGLSLEVVRAKPPEGVSAKNTPIVFIHGAFAGAWCWEESFLPGFASMGWPCTAFSFRGHGESEGRDSLNAFGIDAFVKDLASVVDDLDAPPILIGHSMGGFVAMRYIEGRLDRDVAGLALLASVPPEGLLGPSMSLAMFNPTLLFEIGMVQSGHPDWLTLDNLTNALFSPETPPEQAAHYYPRMNGESQRAAMEMQTSIRIDPERIRGRQPTLVLGARHDTLIPPAFVRSTGRSLGVKAEILPDIGHGMMLGEKAPLTAARIAQWLAECEFD